MNLVQRFNLSLWLYFACSSWVGNSLDERCPFFAETCVPDILEGFQAEETSAGTELRLLQLGLTLQRADRQEQESTPGENRNPRNRPFQQRYVQLSTEDLLWARRQAAQQNPLLAIDELTNSLGGMSAGRRGFSRVPEHKAGWIAFTDHDPTQGFVMGDVQIGPAQDESDVTHYNIFWASNGTVMDFIVALPLGTYVHSLHARADEGRGVPIPTSANEMLVFTSNTAGMMDKGVAVSVFDHWQPPVPKLLKGLLKGL
ncbi:hypothetical protein AK812_SmicGene49094 [Symbiodinium microadriaticum]|uniref:Uncharacterized protein n=1 Tax=Symbiodinium microadriaticum TaxID=2951 RepID=A0A1Q9CF46_SYMMI|nr:hypothetical protein AK812_SmicGene49094 [Symbiodinium microadriaticum]|mmetsp:Transcript_1315/g.3085  ORF Transcript_1315/g.3085 Transcript_1315/m.3085 type:complete len:257 (-) Transcript_1315:122-892(-)